MVDARLAAVRWEEESEEEVEEEERRCCVTRRLERQETGCNLEGMIRGLDRGQQRPGTCNDFTCDG